MLVVQNRNQPSRVLDTISTAIPVAADEIVVAAAYVTKSGTSLIFDRLQKKLGGRRIPERSEASHYDL